MKKRKSKRKKEPSTGQIARMIQKVDAMTTEQKIRFKAIVQLMIDQDKLEELCETPKT